MEDFLNELLNDDDDHPTSPPKSLQSDHHHHHPISLLQRLHHLQIHQQSPSAHHHPHFFNPNNAADEDSLIIQGNDVSYAGKRSIYHLAKDQNGCLLLQQRIDEGNAYVVAAIFDGIIGHVVGLMENPFGNYLVQRIICVCDDRQRIRIVQMVTGDSCVFVRAALNAHGTRAVQKLIATIKTRYEANLIIKALIPSFVKLIKDVNGTHVIQSCLNSLTQEYNKFIFDAAAWNCIDIARHRYGCRVLHTCIAHSSGDQQKKLLAEISAYGLDLAKDAFGNYTVQFILDLQNPTANASFICQFKGNYVDLSKQKFSSNVVEKCIEVFEDVDRAKLILELLYASEFKQLLQDPYANYVIQSALTLTKGTLLHSFIVQAIRPHAEELKSCPYFKQINKIISGN